MGRRIDSSQNKKEWGDPAFLYQTICLKRQKRKFEKYSKHVEKEVHDLSQNQQKNESEKVKLKAELNDNNHKRITKNCNLQSWNIECLKILKIKKNSAKFIANLNKNHE